MSRKNVINCVPSQLRILIGPDQHNSQLCTVASDRYHLPSKKEKEIKDNSFTVHKYHSLAEAGFGQRTAHEPLAIGETDYFHFFCRFPSMFR